MKYITDRLCTNGTLLSIAWDEINKLIYILTLNPDPKIQIFTQNKESTIFTVHLIIYYSI